MKIYMYIYYVIYICNSTYIYNNPHDLKNDSAYFVSNKILNSFYIVSKQFLLNSCNAHLPPPPPVTSQHGRPREIFLRYPTTGTINAAVRSRTSGNVLSSAAFPGLRGVRARWGSLVLRCRGLVGGPAGGNTLRWATET